MLAGRQKLLLEVLIMMLVLGEMNDSNYKMKYLSVLASCSRLLVPFLLTNLARMSQVITLPSFIVHLPRLILGPLSPGSISYSGRHPLLLQDHGPRKIEFLRFASTLAFQWPTQLKLEHVSKDPSAQQLQITSCGQRPKFYVEFK